VQRFIKTSASAAVHTLQWKRAVVEKPREVALFSQA